MKHKPITLDDLAAAVKGVLFNPVNKERAKYENRSPTSKELNEKWTLEKDTGGQWRMKSTDLGI